MLIDTGGGKEQGGVGVEALFVPAQEALGALTLGYAFSGWPYPVLDPGWQGALSPAAPASGFVVYAPVLGRGNAWQQAGYSQPPGFGPTLTVRLTRCVPAALNV